MLAYYNTSTASGVNKHFLWFFWQKPRNMEAAIFILPKLEVESELFENENVLLIKSLLCMLISSN